MAIGVGISAVYRAGPYRIGDSTWGSKIHRTDLTAYIAAGDAVLAGTSIYDARNVRGWYYTALPIFSLVMVPLALMGVLASVVIWYLLSLGLMIHMVWMSARIAVRFYPTTSLDAFWIGCLAALLVIRPLMSGLARGQPSLPAMYLVILSVWLFLQRRHSWAGCALAGSIVLKMFPGLLAVYFALKRRWILAVMTGVWFFVMVAIVPSVVFGIRGNVNLLTEWVQRIGMPANDPDDAYASVMYSQLLDPRILRNQSVRAVTVRILEGSDKKDASFNPSPTTWRVAAMVSALLVLASAWACRRGHAQSDAKRTILEICMVLVLTMLIAPVVWTHYHVLLALPLAVTTAVATQRENSSSRRVARWALILFAIFKFISLPIEPFQAWGGAMWGIVALWAALMWMLIQLSIVQPLSEAIGPDRS